MFLTEPERTQFDLNWRMFGIEVRVHPWFWLVSVVLGWSAVEQGFAYLFIWVLCIFVSILVHELGHVLVGQLFGAYGHVVLYSFGGLAVGSNALSNRWKRIAVCLGGPVAGFLLLGVVWLTARYAGPLHDRPLAEDALLQLAWINLWWGLVNLLPIWPLDGGQISRDFFDWLLPRTGIRASLVISIIAAAGLAVAGFALLRDYFIALFFGWLALNSLQELQQSPWQGRREPWDDWR